VERRVFTNRKRSVVLFAFAAAVLATAACSADVTAPPVKPLALKQRLNLDTAAMCPYGWIVMGGVVVCEDPDR
jgi:hypothetical protein